jgi:hypothetical protein
MWIAAFLYPPKVTVTEYDTPLYSVIQCFFAKNLLISTLTAFVLIVFQAFFLNYIFVKNKLVTNTTFFPAFIYLLLVSSNQNLMTLHPVILLNTFIIIAVYFLFRSFNTEHNYESIFNANFFLSIGFLLYKPACLLFLWSLFTIIIYRYYKFRHWFMAILGALTPIIFLLIFYFVANKLEISYLYFFNNLNIIPDFFVTLEPIDWIFYIIMALFSVCSIYQCVILTNNNSINFRKKNNILILLFFILLAISMYSIGKDYMIVFVAVPLSFMLQVLFFNIKRLRYSNLIFTLLFMLIIVRLLLSVIP